ncbi:MAG TPA: ShlB/FhaC/HecB family hemolysin secretion/activation protein [Allosphingosinicella sp.]
MSDVLKLRTGCAVTAFWLALVLSPAQAQTQAPEPPRPPTRDEVQRPVQPELREPRSRLTVDSDIERAPCALDDAQFQGIRFTPTEIVFEDLRGLAPEALRPAYQEYLGREQPIAALCEIRDRAATILRDAGYVASVEVPVQRIEGGTVRFQVLMARLTAIRVRGDAGRAERTIAGYLRHLVGRDFNRYEAERYLLLASDLPGYNVRLALRSAGAARGEVIGDVTVVRIPGLADFSLQNFGSPELGRWGALARAQLFGVTGLGDRTTFALFATPDFDEQRTVQVGHDFRLGSEGLALSGQLTYAWANPDFDDAAIDIAARTMLATAEASYPFIRLQSHTLRGALGIDVIDQEVDFNDLPLSRERLRVAFLRLDAEAQRTGDPSRYTPAEPRWRTTGSLQLRQGLGILGASRGCGAALANCASGSVVPPSRLEGDPTAFVVRGEALAEWRPAPIVTFALGAAGQRSSQPLFAFEEFSAGNYTVGRGYDPGTLLGDSGIGFQAEVRVGRAYPRVADGIAVQGYVFHDRAWVWNEDQFTLASRDRLSSAGAGVRAAWGDRARLDLVLAVPLERAGLQTERPDPRLLISFTTRLWPWSLR